MYYDAIKNEHGLKHDPFKALVAPRPIGWISSVSADGIVNLAPYSFFNAVSDNPHYVMFSSAGKKDSLSNIEATGEFVCSIASYDLFEQMSKTSQAVGPDIDEMALANLEPAPSKFVKPPRVKDAPAALECKYYQMITLPKNEKTEEQYHVVIGQVVGIYINDAFINDGIINVTDYKPLARLGYRDYSAVMEVFSLKRPG